MVFPADPVIAAIVSPGLRATTAAASAASAAGTSGTISAGTPAGRVASTAMAPAATAGAAIGLAINRAAKGDVVLIAGKGHERGQYPGTSVIPFDDREVAAEVLARRVAAARADAPPAAAPDALPTDMGDL